MHSVHVFLLTFCFSIRQSSTSFCGQSTVPYSLEINQHGEPVLGCARPSCFGWNAYGQPATSGDAAFVTHRSGTLDGFVRVPPANVSYRITQPREQIAICEGAFRAGPCGRSNLWVAGISPPPLLETKGGATPPLLVHCCYSPHLDRAEDRGLAVLRPRQIFKGGEVTLANSSAQVAFDYISDVSIGWDPTGIYYAVVVKRFSCVHTRPSRAAFVNSTIHVQNSDGMPHRRQAIDGNEALEPFSPPPPPPMRGRMDGCPDGALNQAIQTALSYPMIKLTTRRIGDATKKMQEAVMQMLQKPFEAFIMQGEFVVSSYQLKMNNFCRTRVGRFTALVYETPHQYETQASAPLAGTTLEREEQNMAAMDFGPGEPLSGSGPLLPKSNDTMTPHVLTGCDNQELSMMMESVLVPLLEERGMKLGDATKAFQREVQQMTGKSYEVILSKGIILTSSHQKDTTTQCRSKIRHYYTMAYETPYDISNPATEEQFAVMDFGSGERLSGSGPEDELPFSVASADSANAVLPPITIPGGRGMDGGCGNIVMAMTIQKVLAPILNARTTKVGDITKRVQSAIQMATGMSQEVFMSRGDVTLKSQSGNAGACKIGMGGWNLMVYATPESYPVTTAAAEEPFAVMDFGTGEPLSGQDADPSIPAFSVDASIELPNSQGNETEEATTNSNTIDDSDSSSMPPTPASGFGGCGNPQMGMTMQRVLGPLMKTGTRRAGDITKRLQKALQMEMGMSVEVILCKGDLVAKSNSMDASMQCKASIGGWTVMTYSTPVQYPVSPFYTESEAPFAVMDFDAEREWLSGSNPLDLPSDDPDEPSSGVPSNVYRIVDTENRYGGPRAPRSQSFDGCPSAQLMGIMQSILMPSLMMDDMKVGEVTKQLQAAVEAATGKSHEVIIAKGEFEVVSQMSAEDGYCRMRVGRWRSMVYKTPGQYDITSEGRFAVMDLGEPLRFADPPDFLCFPAEATVMTVNIFDPHSTPERRRMDELERDDYVQTITGCGKLVYERIAYWAHRDAEAEALFVQISTANGRLIELTPNHIILKYHPHYKRQTPVELPASSIVKGDIVMTVDGGAMERSEVVRVSQRRGRGIYAPMTSGKRIVVNGVYASCHSITRSSAVQLLFKSYVTHINRMWRMVTAVFPMDYFHQDWTSDLTTLLVPNSHLV